MKSLRKNLGKIIAAVFLLAFVIAPLALYALLVLGWPPVIGNLTAAHAMRTYAAGAHPEWEAKSFWAGYNLVDDAYYLHFDYGTLYYDRDNALVWDEARADALQGELGVRSAVQKANEQPGHYFYWSAGWRPKDPETPYVSLRVDCCDPPSAPVLEEDAMRAAMAGEALDAYALLAPLTPVDRFSVHYCHEGVKGKGPGLVWNSITVDLPEGTELTREQILSAPLLVK